MKIQTLGIIFIIIILPISFALSLYTKTQMQILAVQEQYDSILQSCTYDALKAFQINTKNNTESTLADSKLGDIEASINLFFNSLQSSMTIQGYNKDTLKEFVPALVYTMYDGYYIYSPYSNVATTDENGVTIDANESENIQYGLKPYVYYSCRYKKTNGDDFVITYSLDNYIAIKGIIGGKYINDAGYLISNIEEVVDGEYKTYKYNGIAIEKEGMLKEYLGDKEYPYIKVSGTKFYLDEEKREIFYMLNGKRMLQVSEAERYELYGKYESLIKENSSALRYYKEAYEFTNRVLNTYGLKNLEISAASDSKGNKIEFENNSKKYIFRQDDINDKTQLEYSTSNFNQHRKTIIRYSIETNLSMAIANFNRYSNNVTYDYQMPNLKENDWDMLASNVSIISFLQGIDIGGKIYNGYSVVINSETEELVSEEDIYIIGTDGYYHRVEDKDLLEYGSIGIYTEKSTYSKGVLDLDFQTTSIKNTNNTQLLYYYPRKELACYKCIVNQTGVNVDFEYSSIYEYLNTIKTDTQSTILRKTFYTALGRERWGKQFNEVKIENLDEIEEDKTLEKENNGIEIELSVGENEVTNQDVIATIKFEDSINLDKVVIKIMPTYAEAQEAAKKAVIDEQFIEMNGSSERQETITTNSVIYVIAYSKSGQQVHKSKAVNQIDKTPPVNTTVELTTIEGEEYISGQWSAIGIVQQASATDPDGDGRLASGVAKFEYKTSINGEIKDFGTDGKGYWLINDSYMNQKFYVRAVDLAGNVDQTWCEYTIRIDQTPPSVVTVTFKDADGNKIEYDSANGIIANKDVLVYASSQDNESGISYYEYSYDNGATIESDKIHPNAPLKIENDSYNSYWIRAVNNAGLVGSWSGPYLIRRDTISPGKTTVTLTYEDNGGTYVSGTLTNRNVKQDAYAYDIGGIKEYQYRYKGTTQVHTFPDPWTISTTTNAEFEVRAVDLAGNIGEWSDSYKINIDKDPPVVGNSLVATVQNYNEVKLELTLNNPSDIAKIETKYKIKDSSDSYQTITDTSITTNYQKVIASLEYATTYEMYLILYDSAENKAETNHVYPLTKVAEKDFPYKSTEQTYTVLATGYYKIDAWGSDGADYTDTSKTGGNGGYVTGIFYLTKGQVIKVNTGARGTNYAGTGSGVGSNGGGRTDVTVNDTLLLVAGGGGGANKYYNGGAGGDSNATTTSSATGESGVGAGGGGYYGGKAGEVVYHQHKGDKSTYGGCFTEPVYHTHNKDTCGYHEHDGDTKNGGACYKESDTLVYCGSGKDEIRGWYDCWNYDDTSDVCIQCGGSISANRGKKLHPDVAKGHCSGCGIEYDGDHYVKRIRTIMSS